MQLSVKQTNATYSKCRSTSEENLINYQHANRQQCSVDKNEYMLSSQENDAFLPNENDTVYEIFWSKYYQRNLHFSKTNIFCRAQMRARTHPDMVTVMKALLELWHSKRVPCDHTSLSVAYNHIGLSCFGSMVQWYGRKCSLQDSDMDLSSPLVYVDSLHRRPPWSR